VAAVRALAECESAAVSEMLISRLRGFEPSVRSEAIRTLLRRAGWTKSLLEALSKSDAGGAGGAGLSEPADRQPLLQHRDAEIARYAQKLFGQDAISSRAQIIAEYAQATGLKPDGAAGTKIFERECKSCHKIGDRGIAIGPDLTGSPSTDPVALLSNIL